jgi:hypothetical protein
MAEMQTIGPVVWIVERDEVEREDISRTQEFLRQLVSDPDVARANEENIDLAFSGYDDDPRELCEIPKVRSFIQGLDKDFPYWLFFMSKSGGGLAAVELSFLLPSLTDEGKKRHHPRQLRELIERRWGPALNHLVASLDLPESRADLLLTRSLDYFVNGRLKPESGN